MLHSQQFTQSAQPPPRPRPSQSTWLPGRLRIRLHWGCLHPLTPQPRVRLGAPAHPRANNPVGWGLWKKENSRVCPAAGKSLVPTPFPRSSAQADSSGLGAGRACALRFVLRIRPGGGGERRGLGSHLRTAPPPQPCAQTPCWPPPTPEAESFSRRRLSSRSACPRVPARTNFLQVAGPPSPTSLARLRVTDASETDFPLFQRKGELARAPGPSQLQALPVAPTRSCHSQWPPPPLRRSAARGGGGAAGG